MSPRTSLDRLRVLLETGRHTTTALKEALGLRSDRQVRRLRKRLEAEGLRVCSERGGDGVPVYFLAGEDERRERPPLVLSDAHVLALFVALRAGDSILGTTPLALSLAEVAQSLREHLAGSVDWITFEAREARWYFRSIAATDICADAFDALVEATEHDCTVWLDYQKPNAPLQTARAVDPHAFSVTGNTITLAAWCHEKRAFREFVLARIQRAALHAPEADPGTRTPFDRRPEFDPAAFFRRFGAFAPDRPEPYRVRLRVAARCAPYFRERLYFDSQRIEREHDDAGLTVNFEARGSLDELRTFVQGWGTGVTALGPPELVALLRAEAAELAHRYAA